MKSITKLILKIGFSICIFLTSCSEEDVIEELTGGCVALSEIEDYGNALERFSNDPSVNNCEALKAASIAYLQALKDCPFIEDAALEETLQNTSESSCED